LASFLFSAGHEPRIGIERVVQFAAAGLVVLLVVVMV
jgi:hypothetical protein